MVQFDGLGFGLRLQVDCRAENGKAILSWELQEGEENSTQRNRKEEAVSLKRTDTMRKNDKDVICIYLKDDQNNIVAQCLQSLTEEEPLQSVLLQPHFWQGVKDPYLYRLEIKITDYWGNCLYQVSEPFPLRILEIRKNSEETFGIILNGEKMIPKVLRYAMPEGGLQEASVSRERSREKAQNQLQNRLSLEQQRILYGDLQKMVELGVNCICPVGCREIPKELTQMCDRMGICVYAGGEFSLGVTSFPLFKAFANADTLAGIEIESNSSALPNTELHSPVLFLSDGKTPTPLYYQYKAKWSKNPFVYIVPESLKPLKSGNFTVTCYSNCERVVLYSDGVLFEFQRGEEVFTFWEIPAKHPCIMLSAEGEGCSASLSVHKSFTKLSPNGDI